MKNLIVLISLSIGLISCNQPSYEKNKEGFQEKNLEPIAKNEAVINTHQLNDGYTLMKNNCYVCHNPNTESHDDLIAPPFKAVKMHYTRQYDTKEDFVNAVVNWVQNPKEDNALMYGAVMRFKVMPKLELNTKELEQIAPYIYDNDVEIPEWMGNQMNEMQGKGKGKQGKRYGKGQGQGNGKGMHGKKIHMNNY